MCWRCSPIRRGASMWGMCATTPWATWWPGLKRAQGFNVLHPMGWDAFGMPAENAAMERGRQSQGLDLREHRRHARASSRCSACRSTGTREFATCDPAYYGRQQALFRRAVTSAAWPIASEATVNWDPVDHTVLSQRAGDRRARLAFRRLGREEEADPVVPSSITAYADASDRRAEVAWKAIGPTRCG